MKKRYTISLLVIAILLAFSMTIGTSYAFWSTTAYQNGVNEIAAGCLKIEINDTEIDEEGDLVSTNINLTNAYPMSDNKGLDTKPYTLTIKNVCNIKASYKVLLNSLTTSTLTENEIKYHFIKTSPTTTTMEPLLINGLSPVTLDSNVVEELSNENIKKSYLLDSGELNAQTENVTDSVTYNLRLWIDESVGNEVMGSTYEAAIAVYAEATKK